MDVPQDMEGTISSYRMEQKNKFGKVEKKFRYDLLEVVMVCIGREERHRKGNKLHGMLETLLSEHLQPEAKEKILSEKYDIETSRELEGGLRNMCNLSDLVEERGIRKGIERGIEQGIEQGRQELLLFQIRKKLEKNKSLAQIAEELEESEIVLLPLYEQVRNERKNM